MRGAVFGAIYLAGFYGGAFAWTLAGHAYVPFYEWFGARFGPSGPQMVLAAATLCVALCWGLRVLGSSYLSYGVVWALDAQTNALLVDGPYRYLRHPLYLGNCALAFGVGALATPYGLSIIVLGTLVFVTMLTYEEARVLGDAYGDVFERYRRAVPALLPRLSPAHVEGSVQGTPSLVAGLRAEIMVGAILVGMLLVLARGRAMFPALIALWFVGWMVQAVATRPRER